MENVNELIQLRLKKLEEIKNNNIDAYGARYERAHTAQSAKESFKDNKKQKIKIAGRITAVRTHGKVAFLDIKDESGRLQLYVKEGVINDDGLWLFKRLDIGDIIGAEGILFKTRMGEITVEVHALKMLAKSLKPLPEKWHGLKDVEARYRQRYLDLIANDEVKDIFRVRTKAINKIREVLNTKGYMEVETPMMHPVPGGAAGRPFKTHHNTYDADFYLRIAPELYLKKLLVGGFEKIYELNRSFRNEGVSTRHNPEFTMLEVYEAYADFEDMMRLTEELISSVVKEITGSYTLDYQGKTIDLKPPWQRRSFAEAIGIDPAENTPNAWKKILADKFGLDIKEGISRSALLNLAEDLLDEQPQNKPTFFTDYFTEVSPLAKTRADKPFLAERFELFIGGMEIANAYSELNDPQEQARRIKKQHKEDEDKLHKIDNDFLTALEYGMPPAGGLGIGIDRLIMLITDKASIREVLLFPLLKPEDDNI